MQHTPLWRDDGEATSLPEWVYFAKCVIKARGCVYVCVCVCVCGWVCVCVYVCMHERDREKACVCVLRCV